MPRIARIILPDIPHHITQRGNNRQDIFFADVDRRVYLKYLAEECGKYGVTVQGYSLMTNHVHTIATPHDETGLARAIGRTHFHYTQYINRTYARSGHLWQNRFFSCALDESYFWTALRYVECNPVHTGMSPVAWEYPWSSASAHCGGPDPSGLLDMADWVTQTTPSAWQERLARPEDFSDTHIMRLHTNVGRPLGDTTFMERHEHLLGRRLRPLTVGRPRKQGNEEEIGANKE